MEEQIKKEALAAYPKEAVWLITKKGCRQVENVHDNPFEFFEVSQADTLQAMKDGLLKVVHSHCDGDPVPSKTDMQTQMLMDIPWGVLNVTEDFASAITWWGGSEIEPLEDRKFIHGVSDCYSIVRDYFRLKGVEMADVPRNWQWWEGEEDLILTSFAKLGFEEVTTKEAREGDVWVTQIRNNTPYHCGIVLDNDLILHHPGSDEPIDSSRRSLKEPIFRYLPHIVMFLRLK